MTSIRLRLLLSLLAVLAVAALGVGVVTYRNVLGETEALFDYQLRQMALSLRDQGEIASGQAEAFADEDLDFVVQIWTVDGRSIYASRVHASLPERAALGFADIRVTGRMWRTFGVATKSRIIQVAQPVEIRTRLAARAALKSVVPLVVFAPLMALSIWWLAQLAFAPLERVARELRSRDEQSLSPVATSDLPDEVAPLVASLNGLLDRLRLALGAQRAFVSDAAHELRSPLTALKLQLELLRRAPDREAAGGAIEALAAGIQRAARLVEQLLALARNEPGAVSEKPVEVDLDAVAREAIAATAAHAASRGSEVALDAPSRVALIGHPAALGALMRNLVDNAIRYAPRTTRVEVRCGVEAERPFVCVDDAGPGIPAEERERVFDRFYRREGSDEEGSGLGLAIVKSVAERHAAKLELSESPLGGLRACVTFPARTGSTGTAR